MKPSRTVPKPIEKEPPAARAHKVGVTIPAPLLAFVDQLRVDVLSNSGVRADRGVVVCSAISMLQRSKDASRELLHYLAARSATEKASLKSKATEVQP